jgi:hypothetical protein
MWSLIGLYNYTLWEGWILEFSCYATTFIHPVVAFMQHAWKIIFLEILSSHCSPVWASVLEQMCPAAASSLNMTRMTSEHHGCIGSNDVTLCPFFYRSVSIAKSSYWPMLRLGRWWIGFWRTSSWVCGKTPMKSLQSNVLWLMFKTCPMALVSSVVLNSCAGAGTAVPSSNHTSTSTTVEPYHEPRRAVVNKRGQSKTRSSGKN